MRTYALEALNILERRQYARRHFLTTLLGGCQQNRRVEIAQLCEQGLLRRHNPNGDGLIEHSYPTYFHRIYSLAARKDKFNWHQVGIDDIMLSIEAACKKAGVPFRHREEILDGKPFHLSASIEWQFDKKETYDHPVRPDELFQVGDSYYALEFGRNTETIVPSTFINKKSYLRSLLQYRDILVNKTYQTEWGLPHLNILNVLDNETHMHNIMRCMSETIKIKSKSILFCAYPTLSDSIKSPQPLLDILDRPMLRVGYEPFYLTPRQDNP